MRALNIRFTDEELNVLHRRAEAEGRPVTRLVHDAAMADAARVNHYERVMAVSDRMAAQSANLLKRLADR
jgi:uncharacterized protein (DUF1778 family)